MASAEERRRKSIAAGERLSGKPVSGRTRAGLYELAIRRKKIAKLKADRRAAAKARAARGPATTQAQLQARQEATKETPAPLTQSERAAKLRKRLKPRTRLDELEDVLTQ
jgi:hypothetical protein